MLAQKNTRQVHKLTPENTKEHTSFCPTTSAAGAPLFIFTGKRVIDGVLEGSPPGSVAAFTETGYMRERIF